MTPPSHPAPAAQPLAAVLVGAVVASHDDVPVAAKAAHVDLDVAPGGEAAVLDAELAVHVERAPRMGGQQLQQRIGEGRVVARVVVAARYGAGAAEEVARVVTGDRGATAATEVVGLWSGLVHARSVGASSKQAE